MQILIGTTNPSKVGYFEEMLAEIDAQFVTLHDLGITEEPQETGSTPEENARIKAAFYGQYADIVICEDSGLYLDGLPLDDPRQPGLHVRTPKGVWLDDEQMIEYYSTLAHSLGGKVMAYYLSGIAVKKNGQIYSFRTIREEAKAWGFYLVDTPCAQHTAGWPLDSISLDTEEYAQNGSLPKRKAAYLERRIAFLMETLACNYEIITIR